MERYFKLVRLGDGQKTIYSPYLLKGEAIYLWDSVKALEEVQPVTWTRFKELFLEKYYSRYMQKQMDMKFLELKQGSMTVLEYEKKFIELSRFVTKYVDVDEEKARRFQQGLEYWIRDRMSMFEIGTYDGVVQKAALIESNGAQSRKERYNKKMKVFHQRERSESGYPQDRNMKGIGSKKDGMCRRNWK
ncbi:uncharacterized protein LOC141694003 [Apium graveolens]|uniref:uncharacterized protein LOC141694003 n=1 Tax=Apium graveolens TaxID=4045 RepID=UPI003D7AEBF3